MTHKQENQTKINYASVPTRVDNLKCSTVQNKDGQLNERVKTVPAPLLDDIKQQSNDVARSVNAMEIEVTSHGNGAVKEMKVANVGKFDVKNGEKTNSKDRTQSDSKDRTQSDSKDGTQSDSKDGTQSDSKDGTQSNTKEGVISDALGTTIMNNTTAPTIPKKDAAATHATGTSYTGINTKVTPIVNKKANTVVSVKQIPTQVAAESTFKESNSSKAKHIITIKFCKDNTPYIEMNEHAKAILAETKMMERKEKKPKKKPISKRDYVWKCYDSREQLDLLLKSLDKNFICERRLHSQISFYYEKLSQAMKSTKDKSTPPSDTSVVEEIVKQNDSQVDDSTKEYVYTCDPTDPKAYTKYINTMRKVDTLQEPRTLSDASKLRDVNGQDAATSMLWIISELRELGLLVKKENRRFSDNFSTWVEEVDEMLHSIGTLKKKTDKFFSRFQDLVLALEKNMACVAGDVKEKLLKEQAIEKVSDGIGKEWRRDNCANDMINSNIIGLKIAYRINKTWVDGEIVEYYASENSDLPHLWMIMLDNDSEMYFEEKDVRKALMDFLDTNDDTSDEEFGIDSEVGEDLDQMEEFNELIESAETNKYRIWRNRRIREKWIQSINEINSLSACAYVMYSLSYRSMDYFDRLKKRNLEKQKKQESRAKSKAKRNKLRFADPFDRTGEIVWAKVKGYPYWPAEKVIPVTGMKPRVGYDTVVFFGTGEMAQTPKRFVLPFSTSDSIRGPKKVIESEKIELNDNFKPQQSLKVGFRIACIKLNER